MIRFLYLVFSFCLFPFHLVIADTIKTTIDECWENHSHPEMSECVEARALLAQTNLDTEEAMLRTWISKGDEDPKYINIMLKTFDKSIKSFKVYRQNQCSFYDALSAGGNGAHDLRKACEIDLNISRTELLKAVRDRWAE